MFGQYCERYLDLEHSAKYMQKANFAGIGEGHVQFGYFLRIYKTAFLWKKIFFERKRVELFEQRRGHLFNQNDNLYRQACDMMREAEENCLHRVLSDLYTLCETNEELFQESLHSHCQDESKLQKIQMVSTFGQESQLIMFGQHQQLHSKTIIVGDEEDLFEIDSDLIPKDILKLQNLLNKITLLQVKQLTTCESKKQVYEDFLYVKCKIEDHFYL